MELKIISPGENGFLKEIQWNQEEVKAWVAARVQDYKNIAYTEDQVKDMKKDRADLNKLRTAFESERKRLKKVCMEPYNLFEQQVKEVVALIDEPIQLIDSQLYELEERRKQQKKKDIEALFDTIGFQTFVTLDNIFDQKWLNASVSLGKIEEQMKSIMYKIGEAMEVYKKTLDLNKAILEGQRLAEIQKRKQQYEEEQKRIAEEKARQEEQEQSVLAEVVEETAPVEEKVDASPEPVRPDLVRMDFRVWCTKEQLMDLREYLIAHQIKFGRVE